MGEQNLRRLTERASDPISLDAVDRRLMNWNHPDRVNKRIFRELISMLEHKNGFYEFERALHVFPASDRYNIQSIEKWNEPATWKFAFDFDFEGMLFFAEDAFGNQFGIKDGSIIRFDAETCEINGLSDSLDGWAHRILSDIDYETGANVARDWQKINGFLETGSRLLPKLPFVLGGEYSAENLYSIDAVQGLRFRAEIYNQIKNVPDGTPIEIKVIED